MWVEVLEMKLVGKERTFLNSEGERVSSQVVEMRYREFGQDEEMEVVALCRTEATLELRKADRCTERVKGADIGFSIRSSNNNPQYRFTTCYINKLKMVTE